MKTIVAMSGGVDSSVAAALLVEQGHDVIGVSMQLYDQRNGELTFGSCCSIDDLHDARRVAAALGIPHYVLNFEREFGEHVVSNFVREYAAGRTPLPCVRCNAELKFATLVERAAGFGADTVATGHYARVEHDSVNHCHLLKRGADPSKDQAYFLFSLTQTQLAHVLFPVGDWTKDAVRLYARDRQLPVADKPDSQEICFIPDNDYASFVASRVPDAATDGVILNEAGRVVGRHHGIHRFTVGQRKGLNLPSTAHGSPMYVLEIRPTAREVVVGPRASLEQTTLVAKGVNWIGEPPAEPRRVEAQIRYRHRAAPAVVRALDDDGAAVVFDHPQAAVAPGQAVVFYDGDLVLGGGWIG